MGKTKAVCVGLGVGMVAAGMLTIGTRNILGEWQQSKRPMQTTRTSIPLQRIHANIRTRV